VIGDSIADLWYNYTCQSWLNTKNLLEVAMEIEIVSIKNELRTDSRLLSSYLDHRHRTILENIDKYLSELSQLGGIPFETEKGAPLPHGGFAKSTRYALLNEDQCYFILTLMRNNPHVVKAKLALVKAFSDARAQIAKRDMARIEGKQVRALETQAIKDLVDYASAKGSKSADKYYMIITKMTNSLIGIESGQRNNLPAEKLKHITLVETMVDLAIRDGIKAELDYKEIYQLAKERASNVIKLLSI
jgi:phage regulator Rha-like protein